MFFHEYAKHFNDALTGKTGAVSATAACFATCFTGAAPSGVACGANDQGFRQSIAAGYENYRRIGVKKTEIEDMHSQLLDEYHSMHTVSWKMIYERRDGRKGDLHFDVIYLLQSLAGTHKIFAYISGDEQGALNAAGLV